MTDKKTEALKLALEALEKTMGVFRDTEGSYGQSETDALDSAYKSITAIKEALEQPAHQHDPYGWKVYGVNTLFTGKFAEDDAKAEAKQIGGTCIAFPLYTSPPSASKPLTDEGRCPECGYLTKNTEHIGCLRETLNAINSFEQRNFSIVDMDTSPPARKPLTDEQIKEGRTSRWNYEPDEQPEPWAFRMGVKWAEEKHGIKEKNCG